MLLAKRLKVVRAAACYAELANLAGTWLPTVMEARLENKGVPTKFAGTWIPTVMEAKLENKGVSTKLAEDPDPSTGKYLRYRDGTLPRGETFAIIKAKHAETTLRYWSRHPIANLLLTPALSYAQIVAALEHLPQGETRRLMWVEEGARCWEIPDSEELLEELVALQSIDGLLVILGRMRLRMLLHQTEDIDLYETALLNCFPEIVGGTLHLSIARYPLMQSLSDFLDWQCGWADIRRRAAEKTGEVGTGDFWPSLWHRVEEAAVATASRHIEVDSQHVARVKQQSDRLEQPGEPSDQD